MKRIQFVIIALLFTLTSISQTAPGKYWIRFSDKYNSIYSLSNPSVFLSEESIKRREKFSIPYDERDLPVNENYIDQVIQTCNCSIHNKSKWFNAVTISTDDTTVLEALAALPFVIELRMVHTFSNEQDQFLEKDNRSIDSITDTFDSDACLGYEQYGPSFRQISMLNGHLLHSLGYTGAGIDIAQFDAGWSETNKLPAFEKLRNEGKIKMTRDFVYGNAVYDLSTHGTYVLSTMAGDIKDSLIGTAPDANYYLFRTEDPQSEHLVEEDNWVAAAELCDSLGIDIINSSLGYSEFQFSDNNHTYSDMDGNTTRCSIAADIAVEKGILVVNSAGNSGNNAWRYITAPSDGDSVLCVGAVDENTHHAFFSSYGPSSDGDVKPDVVTMGLATVFAALDSTISTGNGTSFSSPIMAGMAACLMQAFPEKNNMEILHAIRESAHRYNTPTDSLGYGIPDLLKAYFLLGGSQQKTFGDFEAIVFPNPCIDNLNVIMLNALHCNVSYEIYDASGHRIYANTGITQFENTAVLKIDNIIGQLSSGNYTLHLGRAGEHSVVHFQKVNR